MVWQVEFTAAARKEFDHLPKHIQQLVSTYLRKRVMMAEDPRQNGKPLRGDKSGLWRYRIEKYRIVCKIEQERLVVLVVRIAKRDEVYR